LIITFIFDICFAGGMDDLQESGREVLMASGERSYAYEGDEWQNGEFTYHFAKIGIRTGEANIHDYNGNGDLSEPTQVTIEEAFDYARANCHWDRPVIADEFTHDLLP
jgi:metacaspase-1